MKLNRQDKESIIRVAAAGIILIGLIAAILILYPFGSVSPRPASEISTSCSTTASTTASTLNAHTVQVIANCETLTAEIVYTGQTTTECVATIEGAGLYDPGNCWGATP